MPDRYGLPPYYIRGEAKSGRYSAEYRTWLRMVARCHNPRDSHFKNYGAKGIRVCKEWREHYCAFLHHMGRKPSPKHSIDRIDNASDYKPENCRWATASQQLRNTFLTKHRMVTIDGVTKHYADWAEENGLSRYIAKYRIKNGWDMLRACTAPKGTKKNA